MKKFFMIVITITLFLMSLAPNILAANEVTPPNNITTTEEGQTVYSVDPVLAAKANEFIRKVPGGSINNFKGSFELTGEFNNALTPAEITQIQQVLDQTNGLLEDIFNQAVESGVGGVVHLASDSFGIKRPSPLEYSTKPLDEGFRDIEITWNSITLWLTKSDVGTLKSLNTTAGTSVVAGLISSLLGFAAPATLVSIAILNVITAAIQNYGPGPIALKITWTLSTPTNPSMTCQIPSQCRM